MTAEELMALAEARVAELVDEMVAAKLRSLSADGFDALAESLAKSVAVSRALDERVRAKCENEVENRLRCGIYDASKVDRLFESVWTSQLDRAIKERIRAQVLQVCDETVRELLDGIKQAKNK